ncbi:permease [Antrihabitans sp. NCIMB 15449]|uniref:Permease n=1 Tax=Antrihabitans spumae TaxID=3373370 RepID=A0ABW7JT36_9NOCA
MTSQNADPQTPVKTGKPTWLKRTIAIAIAVVVLVIMYFILAAFIPRWWGIRIGEAADGTFTRGIGLGLLLGVVCTVAPLLLFLLAGLSWKKRGGKFVAAISAIIALIIAIPNLMTLSIVVGSGDGAHSGARSLDTEAPGFRGGTLVGAIIGVLVFVLVAFLVVQFKRRGKQLRKAKAMQQIDRAQQTIDQPHV